MATIERKRHRAATTFWRYWTASTVSSVGDAVTAVALPLVAVQVLGASTFEVSLITAAGYVAWLLIGLPAGVLVARLPLRGTQVAMDLVRAAALASVPVAAVFGVLGLPQLVVVALVVGLAGVVFFVGNATLLPAIVPAGQLTARNSLTSGTQAVTQLSGPSLGGILVQAVGGVGSLLVDVASYLVSAVLLAGMPRPARDTAAVRRDPPLAMIAAGLRYVTRHRVMRSCVAAATLANFVCGALLALTPVYLVRSLGASAGLVGVLVAAEGIGSLVGAALTPRLARRVGTGRALVGASLAGAVLALLMPVAGHGWGLLAFAAGNAGYAGGVVVLSVLTRTHRQTTTPPELLSRVMATVRFVSWGAIPLGALAAGGVATLLGNRGAVALTCALAFAVPAVLLAGPVRRLRDLD
ncbi:MFS transporter [Actinocatenispora rupis]|uniref:MFS transporter n=1 Tax=Actinocatenispora rupis TaxID=519421 RepID=A0A8J3NAR6_9ACTN|nr:MFS transporter [Actinocatenispora rupis]GID09980.1 MFS transporter [Actinocatenispora rupis]